MNWYIGKTNHGSHFVIYGSNCTSDSANKTCQSGQRENIAFEIHFEYPSSFKFAT